MSDLRDMPNIVNDVSDMRRELDELQLQVASGVSGGGGGGGGPTNWGMIGGTLSDQHDLQDALNTKANSSDLATVATTGSYDDLSNKPTIPSEAKLYDSVGQNTDGALTQKAITDLICAYDNPLMVQIGGATTTPGPNGVEYSYGIGIGEYATSKLNGIAIGNTARATGPSIAIGTEADAKSSPNTVIGYGAKVSDSTITGSVAIGNNSKATRSGEFNIGSATANTGYNRSRYRVLGGVHDGIEDHDAVTKGQMDTALAEKANTEDIPTVNNPTITINQGGTQKGTFTLNQAGNTTIDLDAGGGGGNAEWGQITGTLSNQTDLQTALNDKRDLMSATSSVPNMLYATWWDSASSSAKQGYLAYSSSATASTIAMRNANGRLAVGTPTATNHATTKAYVDGKTVALTQAEYDALTDAKKNNGTIYFITDAGGGS